MMAIVHTVHGSGLMSDTLRAEMVIFNNSEYFDADCGCFKKADTIRSVPLDKYEEVYGMSYEELLESYSNLEVDDYKRCLMAMRKKAETFEAPYAGAGALMGIKGDSALSSFTPSELTESSAIHGDFDQASLNYSGHQNIEVRAEGWGKTPMSEMHRTRHSQSSGYFDGI